MREEFERAGICLVCVCVCDKIRYCDISLYAKREKFPWPIKAIVFVVFENVKRLLNESMLIS